MKSKMRFFTRKRVCLIAKATVPVTLAALPSLVRAQLTLVSFNNHTVANANFTLTSSPNFSNGTVSNASELVDVNHVGALAASLTSSTYSLAVATSSLQTATAGAVVFDVAAGGNYISFVADDTNGGTINSAIDTISFAGGNVGTTTLASGQVTDPNDLITVTSTVAGTVNVGPSITNYGTLDVSVPTAGGNFDVASNSTLRFGAASEIIGSGSITLNGAGTVALYAQVSGFTGGFNVNSGTLAVGSVAGLGTTAAPVVTSVGAGTLEFTAGSTGTNINRQFAVTSASSVIGVAGTGTLGTVPISAALTGAGSLTKIDTGTLILNSSSTNYAGSTTVLGGALIISNPGIGNLGTLSAMAGAGPVTVGDGSTRAGTFGGNGIIPGDIVVNGNGTLLPGAYTSVTTSYLPATLTGDGSLTIHSGATIFEKVANAGSFDSINLVNAGSLNFDSGTNTVKLALLAVTGTSGPSQTDKYDFITLPAGEIVNNFTPTTYTNGVETTSGTFYIDTSGAAGAFGAPNGYVGIDQPTLTASGDIYFTDVPEPGMSAVIIGLGLPLMRRRRRSSRAESSKASSLITSST